MGKQAKVPYRNGEVTLGQSDGFYVASFDHVGKRKRRRLCDLSRPEAEAKKLLDVFAESRRTLKAQQAKFTIGELWALWMDERAKDGFSNKIYNFNWRSLKPFFANRRPENLTSDDCRAYAKQRFAAGRAPATVHTELKRLRGCLEWAWDQNHLPGKPPKVWTPPAGAARELVLSPEEAGRLVAAARQHGDPHIYLFIVLLFATGGRHRAILDLEWDRVDFAASTIELDDDLKPDPMHKNWRKGRATVWMSDLARAALREAYPGRQCKHVIEHGGRRLKDCREGFANAVARAGLPEDVTPHTIRHTVASWTYGKVQTAFTAQLLGHRDERTTRSIYQHPDPQTTRPAVQVIDATFAALPSLPESRPSQGAKKGKKRARLSKVDRRDREAC